MEWKLIDDYAHYTSFSIGEDEEEKKMKKELLAGGPEVAEDIVNYLIQCGRGNPIVSAGWWNNSSSLVRLIKEFPNVDHKSKYEKLVNFSSNIWEYQTQIKMIAEEELRSL